ncbi:Uma2 family endonuclease [Symmachiella dynata]|uniref:Uma2 family endonuclease n=1 Tax=Symmachiella dynata TaxID=2527995 RepID=UPI0030EE82D7
MSKPQLFITDADAGLELSADEYAEADFQPPCKYERAQRRIIVLPPPGHFHFLIVERIHELLVTYKFAHKNVIQHVIQESWIAINKKTDRRPDLAVYLHNQDAQQQIPQRLPEIVFEIVSPGNDAHDRDYVEKRNDYEQAGVQEYVIVDRFEHRVTVLRRDGETFVESTLQDDDEYTSPLLPGLEIPLQGIV